VLLSQREPNEATTMITRSHGLFPLFTSATWVAIAIAALASGLGCSSSVNGDGDGGAQTTGSTMTSGDGGGASASCPSLQPTNGERCDHEGQVCDFHGGFQECAGDFDRGTCTNGKWRVVLEGPDCSNPCWPDSCPPTFDCPADPPTVGSTCPSLGGSQPGPCTYSWSNGCGGTLTETYTCTGVWEGPGASGPTCSPSQLCAAHASQTDCAADSSCAWFEPGCEGGMGVPLLASAGCYANTDCSFAPDTCALDAPCTQVTIDPCWDSNCDTCGASTYLCVQQ
jgi:hypothetical protein